MQQNEQGQIALKRLRTNQRLVKVSKNKAYVFVPKNNICLAWVEEEDVPKILAIKRNCCGGSGKQEFFYALEHDVARWSGERSR